MPREGRFSTLVERLGIADKIAPVKKPFDRLGFVKEDIASLIGFSEPVPVYCGIHDSNASLLPHLIQREAPFAVVSTGTWVVLFAVGGDLDHLDPARDTLANVDAYGRAVPSARFMGGREFEALTKGQGSGTRDAIRSVLQKGIVITPSVVPGCGPYPEAKHRMVNAPERLNADETYVAASLYAALMTKTCLELTGAAGPVVLEGPFTRNSLYIEALSKFIGRPVISVAGSTGTSTGAALLATGLTPSKAGDQSGSASALDQLPDDLQAYLEIWKQHVQAEEAIG
jgi:sugar (pentulose or hexulose) kinase